ncbi:MAG: ATP-binding protein [Euryarchaeota archaeon]|nr:ATP-binding protein [Euryarchaeota archaeon]MDE2044897.1 ATP-binding protein [Thermoplasmata archaeon]
MNEFGLGTLPRFRRSQFDELVKRLKEPRRFIQVLSGPRQAGKTTLARQALEACDLPHHYASADESGLRRLPWVREEWEVARKLSHSAGPRGSVLVLDEVQKVPGWSEIVKALWDQDTRTGTCLHVVVLGSAPLLVQRGLTESLAGRFEVLRLPHWSFPEMENAFGWDVDRYLFFGGYPGAAPLIGDPPRWARYILDDLVETTLSRDVLLLNRIDKPALLRQLFQLGSECSGQIVSYQKLLGQLQDAGNTTTLAHYLELLAAAGLLLGMQKYSGSRVRTRGSIPKLLVLNTALLTAPSGRSLREGRSDPEFWGRLVETAVGSHLVNSATVGGRVEVTYWREGGREVDYVLRGTRTTLGIEVKSGRPRGPPTGLDAFVRSFPRSRVTLVGEGGVSLADALRTPAADWLQESR